MKQQLFMYMYLHSSLIHFSPTHLYLVKIVLQYVFKHDIKCLNDSLPMTKANQLPCQQFQQERLTVSEMTLLKPSRFNLLLKQ
jgi:hypothetical protein